MVDGYNKLIGHATIMSHGGLLAVSFLDYHLSWRMVNCKLLNLTAIGGYLCGTPVMPDR